MNVQWTLALRYLNGRKLRSFLTTLAVVFGVMVIFSMNAILPGMLQSFQTTMLAAANQVDINISHRTGETFSPEKLAEVRAIEGVSTAQGLLNRPVNLPADFYDNDPARQDPVTVLSLVGLDVEAARTMHVFQIEQGRFLENGDQDKTVIAASLADNLGLHVGDALILPTTQGLARLEIIGILPPRAMPGNEEVLVTLPEAQRLLGAGDRINTIEANLTTMDEAPRAQVQQAIQERLGSDFTFDALSTTSDIFTSFKMAQTILNMLGFLSLFMGGFIIFNTFRTLVAERRRDIGMLRAIGASRRAIIGIILFEGMLQGLVGTAIGIGIGYLLARLGIESLSPFMESMVHIKIQMAPVSTMLVIGTIILGVGTTVIAGLLPAMNAGRITPMEALRPSMADVQYRRVMGTSLVAGLVLIALSIAVLVSGSDSLVVLGAMLFMFGLVLVAPALVRPFALAFGALVALALARNGTGYIAQGNLVRQPTRAAITASTTMIAMALLVVAGGLTTTLTNVFFSVLKDSLGSDYLFIPPGISVWANNVGADASFVDQLRQVDGVGPVSAVRFSNAIADIQPAMPDKAAMMAGEAPKKGITISTLGIDPTTFSQVSRLQFNSGTAEEAFAALASGERVMIINGILASTSGLKTGDTVPLITPAGRFDYRVVGVGTDFLNLKITTAWISHAAMARDFHKTEDVFIQLNLKPGVDPAAVEPKIKAIKQQYPQFSMFSGQKYLDQMMSMMRIALSSLYLIFIFLAIPSLIAMLNTLAIGVIERTREIGMLRAVGATQAQIRRMVSAEAVLLALVGTAFGLLAGLYLGYALIGAFRQAGFALEYYFPWNGLVIALAVGLLFGALAALIPSRQAARMQIVQSLRYE